MIHESVVPKEPPPEFEFIADPPSISAFDLDVVKLTAQFVARNGRQFLTQLMQKEQRNFQFDFLRPQHSLFNYFTKLVEQYTKVRQRCKEQIRLRWLKRAEYCGIHLSDWLLAGFNPSKRSFSETEEGSRESSWGLGPGNYNSHSRSHIVEKMST